VQESIKKSFFDIYCHILKPCLRQARSKITFLCGLASLREKKKNVSRKAAKAQRGAGSMLLILRTLFFLPTSTFFTQRSAFDISIHLVLRLPAAGRYLALRTSYLILHTLFFLPTSTFFTQRSAFDISLNLVPRTSCLALRLPAAGRYLILRTLLKSPTISFLCGASPPLTKKR
jgi:hypothetical protein